MILTLAGVVLAGVAIVFASAVVLVTAVAHPVTAVRPARLTRSSGS